MSEQKSENAYVEVSKVFTHEVSPKTEKNLASAAVLGKSVQELSIPVNEYYRVLATAIIGIAVFPFAESV